MNNATAYQGQESIKIDIPSDLFYDPDDILRITVLHWYSNDSFVSNFLDYEEHQSILATRLYPNFAGTWEITLIGVDSINQSAKAYIIINGISILSILIRLY